VVNELYATDAWFGSASQIVEHAASVGISAQLITDRAAKALSDTVTPPGLVAVCSLVDVPLGQALAGTPTLVAVPVAVSEPGNAGTITRVADAAGADAVVFAGDGVDPHNGKCVRSSAGSLFHLPIVRERSVDDAMAALSSAGLQIVATAADGEVDLDDADELLAAPTAWLFGNEAHGLPTDVLAAADVRVRIPIHGRAESLNLATAAALCLYASARTHRRR
jgi:TrmH family RNA methyltransferase